MCSISFGYSYLWSRQFPSPPVTSASWRGLFPSRGMKANLRRHFYLFLLQSQASPMGGAERGTGPVRHFKEHTTQCAHPQPALHHDFTMLQPLNIPLTSITLCFSAESQLSSQARSYCKY